METETKELQMFINKVNIKKGWIDYIDAFRLVNLYTNCYGVLSTTLSIEDELVYMWNKINNIEIEKGIIKKKIEDKVCCTCKLKLTTDDFTKDKSNKDGLDYKCKDCKNSYSQRYRKNGPNKKYKKK